MSDEHEKGVTMGQAGHFMFVVATLLHWGIYTLIKEIFHLQESDDWELTIVYSVEYVTIAMNNES